MANAVEEIGKNKMFGGWNRRYQHNSSVCGCKMIFQIYFPPAADSGKVPVIFYLSGLTCTDENFIVKAGAQRVASELGIALIAPDTSPRGLNIPGESDNWDFGSSAGFYLNATVEKWKNWRMYDYVVTEMPELIQKNFPNLDLDKASIMGHSMGGHGAITIALKNPARFKSISAFSPICNPTKVGWGQKAFRGYLGDDQSQWTQYDATELMMKYDGPRLPILIDTGTDDPFLADQLTPWVLEKAALDKQYPLTSRMQAGYNHSYFFMATFMGEHIQFHAKALGLSG